MMILHLAGVLSCLKVLEQATLLLSHTYPWLCHVLVQHSSFPS